MSIKQYILIIIFLQLHVTLAQEGGWNIIDTMPLPVAGGSALVVEDDLYIFGGYSDLTQDYVDWIQKYNFNTEEWSLSSYMRTPRYGLVTGNNKDTIYICGGVQSNTELTSSLEKWNFSDSSDIVFSNFNFDRIYPTGTLYNKKLYLFGGNTFIDNQTLPYLLVYSVNNNSFFFYGDSLFLNSVLPEQQMSAMINDDIYVFGGVLNGVLRSISKYNTNTDVFQNLNANLVNPRAAGSAVTFGQTEIIFLIGGYNESSSTLSSVEMFYQSGSSFIVEEGPDLNIPRRNCMAVYYEDAIYIFGGFNENNEVISEIEQYKSAVTSIQDNENNLSSFKLKQNYPNPFNPVTTIEYYLPDKVNTEFFEYNVTLKVFNLLGREIEILIDEEQNPGSYKISFDASNLTSGVYFYQLIVSDFIQTKKMVLIR